MKYLLVTIKELLKISVGIVIVNAVMLLVINMPLLFHRTSSVSIDQVVEMETKSGENRSLLVIPKLGVTAPIVFSTSIESVERDLSLGVSHYPESAIPGQLGNVFISGHSSDYPWKEGDYKQVFLFLSQLNTEDVIYIWYGGTKYTYKVTGQRVVDPSDLGVLTSEEGAKTLTLMTCYPPNTLLSRLVVTATQQ